MAIADRREGRGLHDALHAGVTRGAQHAERAVDRRADQFVLVLGLGDREGGGDMLDIVASRDRLCPAIVLLEIGRGEGQPVEIGRAGAGERVAHRLLLGQRAHGSPHLVPRFQQLQDDMPADEAGSPSHQNLAHLGAFPVLSIGRDRASLRIHAIRSIVGRAERRCKAVHHSAPLRAAGGAPM